MTQGLRGVMGRRVRETAWLLRWTENVVSWSSYTLYSLICSSTFGHRGVLISNLFLDFVLDSIPPFYPTTPNRIAKRQLLEFCLSCNICSRFNAYSPQSSPSASIWTFILTYIVGQRYIQLNFSYLPTTSPISLYANGVCSSFLNGSRENSSAEQGYEISNFSSTVG